MITIAPPTSGYSDKILSDAIARASVVSKPRNKNITIVMEEGEYRFKETVKCHGSVSLVSGGRGRRSVRMTWPSTYDDMNLLEIRGCNGSVFDGINIMGFGSGKRVTGLASISNSSCVFSNLDIQVRAGVDSLGLRHEREGSHGESCVYEKFDIRSSGGCVEVGGGDNNTFRDFDCTAGVNVLDTISAIFRIAPKKVPHHLNIRPGTGQRGRHMYYCNSISNNVSGGFIKLDSFRWEQPASYDTTAIIHIPERIGGAKGHVTERFTIINCRHSP